jgi:hypothetical protein
VLLLLLLLLLLLARRCTQHVMLTSGLDDAAAQWRATQPHRSHNSKG